MKPQLIKSVKILKINKSKLKFSEKLSTQITNVLLKKYSAFHILGYEIGFDGDDFVNDKVSLFINLEPITK
ncbi:MAG: hypothetical protein IMZ64_01740 [Bacteroidetes bacterium]|nr:hypothetical protein [Bacteroidota bacterium]